MDGASPKVRLLAPRAELPLAITCVTLAAVTLIWKTVGLSFLPGWDEMFGGVGAQYPREPESLSGAWSVGYLLVYGVFGTAATLAGLFVTLRRGPLESPAGFTVSRCARVLGAFHVVIAIHHTIWAATAGAWGHLTLEQYGVPGLYVIGGIAGFVTGLHGLRLLRARPEDPTYRLVRSKIAVDGVSVLTFISVLLFFPMNVLGLERNESLERVAWTLVFVAPALWLLADGVIARTSQRRVG